MNDLAINKLLNSISDLEQAVNKVQVEFQNRNDIPETVISRLAVYREITEKQKSIWAELPELVDNDDHVAIMQRIGKINALSSFLLDDLRAALAALEGQIVSQFIVAH